MPPYHSALVHTKSSLGWLKLGVMSQVHKVSMKSRKGVGEILRALYLLTLSAINLAVVAISYQVVQPSRTI